MSSHARLNTRQVLARIGIGAVLWFGGGLVTSRVLGMSLVDSIAFLLCLGVVFLLGSVFFTAVYGPKGESE